MQEKIKIQRKDQVLKLSQHIHQSLDELDKVNNQQNIPIMKNNLTHIIQGSRSKWNQICEDLMTREKSPESISLWIDAFRQQVSALLLARKKLSENDNNNTTNKHWNLIIELVLYKIPWFKNSENHLEAVISLKSFCVTLLSLHASLIQ